MKGLKFYGNLIIVMVGLLVMSGLTSAMNVTIDMVEVDEDTVYTGLTNILDLERGETLDIKVRVTAHEAFSDVQVEAEFIGIHNEDVEDETDTFDMKAGVTYIKKLRLTLPDRMDQDRYKLRVRVEDRDGDTIQSTYEIEVDTKRNLIQIKDVVFSPSHEVLAGRSLLTTVRIKNYGEKDEDGIKVTVSVPDLGLTAADYIDELEAGDSTTSEELYMRIPTCIPGGTYDVNVKVTYDDGDESVSTTRSLKVVEDESCNVNAPTTTLCCGPDTTPGTSPQRTTITVPQSQDVKQGAAGAVFPVVISNAAGSAVTYTLTASGLDTFGGYSVDPSNVVIVPAGATSTVYLYVSADEDAQMGKHVFALTVTSADGSQTVSLEANVVEGDGVEASGWAKAKKALEIGLVVLVVLLVVLGLIVGFNKLKGNEEEDEDTKGKTYY